MLDNCECYEAVILDFLQLSSIIDCPMSSANIQA